MESGKRGFRLMSSGVECCFCDVFAGGCLEEWGGCEAVRGYVL